MRPARLDGLLTPRRHHDRLFESGRQTLQPVFVAVVLLATGTAATTERNLNLAVFCNAVGHGASPEKEWIRVEVPLGTYPKIAAGDEARQMQMDNHCGARDRWGNLARTVQPV